MRTLAFCVLFGALALNVHAQKKKEEPAKAPAKPASAKPIPGVESAKPEPTEAQQAYADGVKLLEKGSAGPAQEKFKRVLELIPNNVPALVNLGMIEQRLNHPAEAEQFFKRAIREQPENGASWMLLGVLCYEQGKLEAATAHLAQAALYAPNHARVFNYLGATMSRRGWYSAAEEQLRKAIELDPKGAEAHYNLAALYLERQPPAIELARRHYEKSLELGGEPDAELVKKIEQQP